MAYRQTARVQEQLLDKRDRILQAVRAVVGEVGFHGAQVAVVAEAAGIAPARLSALPLQGRAVRRDAGAQLPARGRGGGGGGATDGPAASRLADAVRVFACAPRARVALAYAMFAEPAEPEVDAARLVYRRAFADVLEGADRGRHAAGEFPPSRTRAPRPPASWAR